MSKLKMLQKLYEALDDVFESEEDIENLDYGLIEDLIYHIHKIMEELKE